MKTLIISILLCFYAIKSKESFPTERIEIIQNSGDGKSFKTAYEVYSIDEEYQLLEHLKLNPTMQMLSIIEGEYYDILKIGETKIYFKIILEPKKQSIKR
tara:strand:+ start:469 stop:768 length:300 start_codon:yes stop_codon:yes gene_type:complete